MTALRISSMLRMGIVAACAASFCANQASAVPAFPGAEGFGANATGGRGGTVYHVTNLNDSGAGSFRDAVSAPNRIVVFDVGGIINLTSGRVSVKSNITIAGQTAPGEGITIYGNGVSFSNANNSIVRYIRFRQGINGDSGTDAVGIASGDSMIFDHVSASWGRDETFSVSGSPSNITLQDCIVGQGLLVHSAGGLMQTDGGVSVFRSFYADNWMRNPKVKGVHEFTNNVVYNWGSGGGYIAGDSAGQSYTNIIGNYFSAGPNTGGTPAFIRGNLNFHVYAANNLEDANLNGVADGVVVQPIDQTPVDTQATRYPYPAVATLLSPQQAFDHVLTYAGASLHRDSVDTYMINELLSHGTSGKHIYSEAEVGGVGTIAGGIAPTDTDGDGMPDWWEQSIGTDPAVADHNGDVDSDGYTNLENYINSLTFSGVPGAIITGIITDTGAVNTDGNTADQTLVISGTAIPGSTVSLRRAGSTAVIGTTTAAADGTWTFDYTGTTLPENYHVFTATATVDGRESPPSKGFVVRVDITAATSPVITSLVTSPSFTFNGTSEPNVAIAIFLDGAQVAETVADGLGKWSAPYTGAPLSSGVYSFTAVATDLAGNTGVPSTAYVVDTALSSPVFTGIVSDTGVSTSDQITSDTSIVINGTAPAGAVVSITRIDTGVVGTATADASGLWSFNYTGTTLANGIFRFTATASVSGNSSPASLPYAVTIDTARPTIPSIVRYNPATAATSASTVVFRVTMNEPVVDVDVNDFVLNKSVATITGQINAITQVSPSVYDVTVTDVSGDGTLGLSRPASATIRDLAGNVTNSAFNGGQSYMLRLPGSGVWTNTEVGQWSDPANWEDGVIATGSGATADFATRDLDGEAVVQFDAPRTLGRLVFADADVTSPGSWRVTSQGNSGNSLTLETTGTPTLQVIHTGDTGVSNPTLATSGQLVPAILDVPVISGSTLEKTGWGTVVITQPASIATSLNVKEGVLKIGAGGSMTNTSVAVGNSAQFHVAGGTFKATGETKYTNGGFGGVYVSGGTAEFTRITNAGDRDGIVKVTGGTLTADELLIPRSSNGDIALTNTSSVFQYGFVSQGGTTNLGTFNLASGNSWAFATIDGGEVNISASAIIANQATSGRGARLRMLSGRLNVTDVANGLVLSRKNGSNANNIAGLYLFGGTATLEKLTLGYDSTVTGGYGLVSLEGGSLYLGSGGLVKNGTFATYINLYSGILGAKDSWTSTVPMSLVATGAPIIHAGDEAGNARDITLAGVLSDWAGTMPAANLQNPGQVAAGGPGGFVKTGAGTLTLAAANTFTGDVTLSQGALSLTGSLAEGGVLSVNSGGLLSGTGSTAKAIALNAGGTVSPGIAGAGSLTASTLTWNDGGRLAFDLGTGNTLSVTGALSKGTPGSQVVVVTSATQPAADSTYPLASFGTTDLTAADLSLAPTSGFLGLLQLDATTLRFLVTGVGATAEYGHWTYVQNLPADKRAAGDDPDGDGIPNLVEFYLALNPMSAAPEGTLATTVAADGQTYPAIAYIRRKAVGGVNAEVLVSPALDFASLLGAIEVSASDNGDGTESVVVRSTVPLAQQPRQFFRVAITLPTETPAVAKTAPMGVISEALQRGKSGLSFPLIAEDLFVGVVSANSSDTLTFSVTAGSIGALLATDGRYYVEVLDGAFEGERLDIDSAATIAAAGASIVVDLGDDTHSTLTSLITDALAGARIAVRPHLTLGKLSDMFTPGLTGAEHRRHASNRADTVSILDDGGFDTYFIGEDGESWYSVSERIGAWARKHLHWSRRHGRGASEPVDYRNLVIPPDVSIVVDLNSGAKQWIQAGLVRTNAFRKNLERGSQAFASGFPVDFSPAGIGAFVDASAPANQRWYGSNIMPFADQIEVLFSGRKPLSLYYLKGDGHTWQTLTRRGQQGYENEEILGVTDMVVIRRRNADPTFVIPRPFSL